MPTFSFSTQKATSGSYPWANWNLFGLDLSKVKQKKSEANNVLSDISTSNTAYALNPPPTQKTFAIPPSDDGTVVIQGLPYHVTYVDWAQASQAENEQITRYREVALRPEVEDAIDNIVNEAIVRDETGKILELKTDNLDNLGISEDTKKKISNEFDNIIRLMNFGNMGYEIFRKWYIDGRMYFHMVVDENKPQEGIKAIKWIDPRCIRKIREITKERDPKTGIETVKYQIEYYLYNPQGIVSPATNLATKINKDAIVYVTSGLFDAKKNIIISHLHKALKPANQLGMVEDAVVIYRLVRAPERRVFYVDVGNLPFAKAQSYLEEVMKKYKNQVIYDASTGEVKDQRNHLSMLQDFWLPRREGGKGTEISTLPGGENLGRIEDIEYFLKKLYKALSVPISRLEPSTGFTIGRSQEINRDEIKFMKFIDRLRMKFSQIFDDLLKTQLILKGICNESDWEIIRQSIYYDFLKDNNFAELKNLEIMRERLALLQMIDPYQGKYYSVQKIRRDILQLTEEEIEEMEEQIEEEKNDPRFLNPTMIQNQQLQNQIQQMGQGGFGGGFGGGFNPNGQGFQDDQTSQDDYNQIENQDSSQFDYDQAENEQSANDFKDLNQQSTDASKKISQIQKKKKIPKIS